jgi:O-antigen ligase
MFPGPLLSRPLGGTEVVAALPLLFNLVVLPWMFGGRSEAWLVAAEVLTFVALGALGAAGKLALIAPARLGTDRRLMVLLLGALAAGAGVSAIFSGNPGASYPLLIRWLWLGASGMLALMLSRGRSGRELLVGALLVAVFAQAFWAFYVWWGSQDPLHQQVGTFYAPNQYAGYLLLLAPLLLAISLTSASRLKAAGAGFAAAYLYLGVALSGSRAGAVAAGCGILAMAVVASARWLGRTVLRTALVVAAVAGLGLLLTGPLLFRSPSGAAGAQGVVAVKGADPASLIMRLHWDGAAVQMGVGHPLAGTGLGTYGAVFSTVEQPRWQWSMWAHNQYLEAFAEGGLPLLLGMVGLPALGLIRGHRALRRGPLDGNPYRLGLWAGLLGGAAHLLVDHDWSYPAYAVAFVVVAVLVVAPWDGPEDRPCDLPAGHPSGARRRKLGAWRRTPVAGAAVLCALVAAGGFAGGWLVRGRNGADAGNLRLAMVLEPYAPAPYAKLAERLAAQGGPAALAQAAGLLRSAVRRDRLDPTLRWELASVAARRGDAGSARQAYSAAIAMAPGDADAYTAAAAYELSDAHDPARAAQLLDQGIARLRAGAAGSPVIGGAAPGVAALLSERARVERVGR